MSIPFSLWMLSLWYEYINTTCWLILSTKHKLSLFFFFIYNTDGKNYIIRFIDQNGIDKLGKGTVNLQRNYSNHQKPILMKNSTNSYLW